MRAEGGTNAVLNQVRDWLRWRGWFVIRMQQGLGCHKGMSDHFKLCLLLTHYVDLQDAMPQQIVVSRGEDGLSRVEVAA